MNDRFRAWRLELAAALHSRSAALPYPAGEADDLFLYLIGGLVLVGVLIYGGGGYHSGFAPLNDLAPSLPEWVWQGVTIWGDERFALALALFFSRRFPQVFWAALVAAAVALVYSRALKFGLQMPRPPAVLQAGSFNLIGPAHRYHSFPSGHSVTAFTFAGVCLAFVHGWKSRGLLLLLATLAAASRVVVGVHWPLDALGGALGGLAAAWVGVRVSRHWQWGLRPGPHLLLLALPLAAALSLLIDDGGYPGSHWLARPLAILAILFAVREYRLPYAFKRPPTANEGGG